MSVLLGRSAENEMNGTATSPPDARPMVRQYEC
jgi:hypothetical protein